LSSFSELMFINNSKI